MKNNIYFIFGENYNGLSIFTHIIKWENKLMIYFSFYKFKCTKRSYIAFSIKLRIINTSHKLYFNTHAAAYYIIINFYFAKILAF